MNPAQHQARTKKPSLFPKRQTSSCRPQPHINPSETVVTLTPWRTTSTGPRPADRRSSSRQSNTSALSVATSEHWRIPATHISFHPNVHGYVLQRDPLWKSMVQPRRADSPQHIRHDEVSHMRSANVYLVQMADTAITRRHGDVFKLHVHVVLG